MLIYHSSLLFPFFSILALFLSFGITPLLAETDKIISSEKNKHLEQQCHSNISVALVIANSQYQKKILKQSLNDAKAIRKVLKENGFKVIFKTNLNLKSMNQATREFSKCLKISQGMGLFYFTGYGMQLNGKNYILPIDIDIMDKMDVKYDTFPMQKLFDRLKEAKNELNIVILDASHKSPYRFFEHRGLANESPLSSNFLIAHSTDNDKNTETYVEGEKYSLYLRELIKVLEKSIRNNTRIVDMFMQLTNNVERASNGRQIPWYSSSLKKPFCFGKCRQSHVQCIKKYPDSIYKGQCKNGIPEGVGTMIFDNGEMYKGQYKNGIRNGFGTHYFPDGFKMQGIWENGTFIKFSTHF
ncbi:peptidase C14 caspase catalytic subunit p20 [Candidatus Thiomargarita nelsonii]|uniref:Peptidase C14 caspase catalytic subunit p20 n=1 Tax=Candidatus Thiomargarita nelsonii TaxID=1003181 RepID=A0A0A6P0V4_9GAMM|nr:peptidase C14 caspase catalytic subunit p20 [Candidatus Thiomargarita nelsonii]